MYSVKYINCINRHCQSGEVGLLRDFFLYYGFLGRQLSFIYLISHEVVNKVQRNLTTVLKCVLHQM